MATPVNIYESLRIMARAISGRPRAKFGRAAVSCSRKRFRLPSLSSSRAPFIPALPVNTLDESQKSRQAGAMRGMFSPTTKHQKEE